MRTVVQRVSEAKVVVNGQIVGQIGRGLLVFLGIGQDDQHKDADYLAGKITKLRIFPDAAGRMNLSVLDSGGEMLIVSQFTLYGDTHKGNRPSYSAAASPETAKSLYDYFIQVCRSMGINIQSGMFQAHMEVTLTNDGPVTLMCNSDR